MESKNDIEKILSIISEYVTAFKNADADLMQSLFWFDDPRFMEVENHIPIPFGRDRFLYIMDWIRKHQKPGWNMEFMNTKIFILSPTVAYSVSLRKETIDGEDSISRVTLIYLKKDGIWKIIHGHFSYVPE